MLRFLALLLFLSAPTLAEETYSPDFCGFEVTFPDAPYSIHKCDGTNTGRCYDLVSYTKNFGPEASVHVEVICNPLDASVYSSYDQNVMEATLKAMRDKDVIKNFETSATTDDRYKQANLIGEGVKGVTPMLYIAQLWIDRASAFSVEAELIGEAQSGADQLFSDILKSIHPVAKDADKPEKDQAAVEE